MCMCVFICATVYVNVIVSRPDMTFAVYWALKTNYLSVRLCVSVSAFTFVSVLGVPTPTNALALVLALALQQG